MRKPNKIWVDKGSEVYNRSMKPWLKDNDIEMYSTHNEGKSLVAESLIRTLKNKIYNHMTALSENIYIDKLDNTINEYNNTYHRTIKMKSVDVKDNGYVIKILNSKLVIMEEFQNSKTFLLKDTLQVGLKKIL